MENKASSNQDLSYRCINLRTHIYERPHLYIGSTEPILRKVNILKRQTLKVETQEIVISEAIEKLYLEVITNARDHIFR